MQTVTGLLQEQVTEYVDIIHNNSRNKKICVIIANLHFEITVHVLQDGNLKMGPNLNNIYINDKYWYTFIDDHDIQICKILGRMIL